MLLRSPTLRLGANPAKCRHPARARVQPIVRASHLTIKTSDFKRSSPDLAISRRDACMRAWGVMGSMLSLAGEARAESSSPAIEVVSEDAGFGTREAQKGDLLLLHYVGKIKETGQVFDSTRGGLMYRDGGIGVFRPIIIRLGGDPVPGVCAGLRKGLEGMRVGGKRTFVVPPELGFANTVLAPYAILPGGSTLEYEVELLRLSACGPDELTKGIDRCGQGGASQATDKCGEITYAEFV